MWDPFHNEIVERAHGRPQRITIPEFIKKFGVEDARTILYSIANGWSSLDFNVIDGPKRGSYQLVIEAELESGVTPNFVLVGGPT